MIILCSACSEPAAVKINDACYLCERCDVIARREFPRFPVDSSSPGKAPAVGPGSAVGADYSVSDGAVDRSLPSGESEPSVMLACAPSESFLDIPAFLKRDQNNVPAYARAA